MNQSQQIIKHLQEDRLAHIMRDKAANTYMAHLDNDDFTSDDIVSAAQVGFRKGRFGNDGERGAVVAGSDEAPLIQWLKSRGIRVS